MNFNLRPLDHLNIWVQCSRDYQSALTNTTRISVCTPPKNVLPSHLSRVVNSKSLTATDQQQAF